MPDPTLPNIQPGTSSLGPWDFSEFLRRTAGQQTVAKGAGGSYIIQDASTLPFTMESAGIKEPREEVDVKTNDPKLDEPAFAGLGLWSLQLAQTFTNLVLRTPPSSAQTVDTLSGSGESLAETLQYRFEGLQQYLSEIGPEAASKEEGLFGTQITGGPEGVPPNVPKTFSVNQTVFADWVNQLKEAVANPPLYLPPETINTLDSLKSTDPTTINTTLVTLANVDALHATPDTKKVVQDKLTILSGFIADTNAQGGSMTLNMTVPSIILPAFVHALGISEDTSMTSAEKTALYSALFNISNTLGKANFQDIIQTRPEDPSFTALTASNAQKISTLLVSISRTYTRPKGVSTSDVSLCLSSVATTLAALGEDDKKILLSVSKPELTSLLSKSFNVAAASGSISPQAIEALKNSLLPLLVEGIFSINHAQYAEGIRSLDVGVLRTSITALSEVETDSKLSPPSKIVLKSYLQVLLTALTFMANVRATMSTMETEFTTELSRAKQANILAEVTFAASVLKNQIATADTKLSDMLSQISTMVLLKYLMPAIGIAVAVGLFALAIGAAVLTVLFPPAGIAAFGTIGGIVIASVGVIGAAVSLALTITDAGLQMGTDKGMWQRLSESLGVTDPNGQAALSVTFQLAIQAIFIVATLGTELIVAAIKAASDAATRSVLTTIKEAIKAALENLNKEILKSILKETAVTVAQTSAGAGVSYLFASGVITQGLNKVAASLGLDAKEQMIFTAIMSSAIMVTIVIASIGANLAFNRLMTKILSEKEPTLGAVGESTPTTTVTVTGTSAVSVEGVRAPGALEAPVAEPISPTTGTAPGGPLGGAAAAKPGATPVSAATPASTTGATTTTTTTTTTAAPTESLVAATTGQPTAAPAAPSVEETPQPSTSTAPTQPSEAIAPIAPSTAAPTQPTAPPTTPSTATPQPTPEAQAQAATASATLPPKPTTEAPTPPEQPATPQIAAEMPTPSAEAPSEGGLEGLGTGAAEEVKKLFQKITEFFTKLIEAFKEALQQTKEEMGISASFTETLGSPVKLLRNFIEKLKQLKEFESLFEDMEEIPLSPKESTEGVAEPLPIEGSGTVALKTADLQALQKLLSKLIDFMTKNAEKLQTGIKITDLFIEVIGTLAKGGGRLYQASAKISQAEIDKKLAVLEKNFAELQAILGLLLDTSSLDQSETIRQISKDASDSYEGWAKLLELVSSFIEDASKDVSQMLTHAK